MLQWFICSVSIEWNVRATLVTWTCFGSRQIKLMPSWGIVYWLGVNICTWHTMLAKGTTQYNNYFYWQDRMIGESDFI
jgi:hypothetical protein